jgi:hypothetical protein
MRDGRQRRDARRAFVAEMAGRARGRRRAAFAAAALLVLGRARNQLRAGWSGVRVRQDTRMRCVSRLGPWSVSVFLSARGCGGAPGLGRKRRRLNRRHNLNGLNLSGSARRRTGRCPDGKISACDRACSAVRKAAREASGSAGVFALRR